MLVVSNGIKNVFFLLLGSSFVMSIHDEMCKSELKCSIKARDYYDFYIFLVSFTAC